MGGSDIQISLHPVGHTEGGGGKWSYQSKSWANTGSSMIPFSPKCRGFWVLLPLHSTYFKSIPPSFPAKLRGFFWTPEQAPCSDFDAKAVDLASLAKPWEYKAGLVGLGGREAIFLTATIETECFKGLLAPPICLQCWSRGRQE